MKRLNLRISDSCSERFNKLYEQSVNKTIGDFFKTLLDKYEKKEGIIMDNVFNPITSQRQEFDYARYQQQLKTEHSSYIDKMLVSISETGNVDRLIHNIVSLPKLSIDNLLSVTWQQPDFTVRELKTFTEWNKEGVKVKKNEKAISLLRYEGQYQRQDGSYANSFAIKKVFDISQTTKDYKTKINGLENQEIKEAIIRMLSPFKIEIGEPSDENKHAIVYDATETVLISTNPRASDYEIIKELIFITFKVKLPMTQEEAEFLIPQHKLAIHMILEGFGFNDDFPVSVQKHLKGKEPDYIKEWLNNAKELANNFLKGVDICHETNNRSKEYYLYEEKIETEKLSNEALESDRIEVDFNR